MGNVSFRGASNADKLQVSKKCADQFLLDDHQLSSEEKWMIKLRNLDEEHSLSQQLTKEDFDKLLSKLENRLKMSTIPNYCRNKDIIIECLRRNPSCMLNCKREMDEFIDCVDAIRVRRIKETIKESIRKKRANLDAMFNS